MKDKDIQHLIDSLQITSKATAEHFNDETALEIAKILDIAIFNIEEIKLKHKKMGLFSRTAQFFKGVPR